MSDSAITILVATAGVLISWGGSAFIAGYRWGTVNIRLKTLESQVNNLATKEQLTELSKDLSEIRGMFRLAPRITDA